jgi:hypothetical protein
LFAAGGADILKAVRRRFVLGALLLSGCGGSPAPAAKPASAKPRPAPLAAQAGYCERLSPWLEKSTKAADLGVKLACLDVPGVTEIGRFGARTSPEEDSLANCFERKEDYASVVEVQEGSLELGLDDEFVSETGAKVGARLSDLVPWLPSVSVSP